MLNFQYYICVGLLIKTVLVLFIKTYIQGNPSEDVKKDFIFFFVLPTLDPNDRTVIYEN